MTPHMRAHGSGQAYARASGSHPEAAHESALRDRKLLAETAARELKDEEGWKLLKAFRDAAEAAEAGMGAMLG